jgi:hypothetical protein
MRISDDDDGGALGTILMTAIVTVVLGALIYAYNSSRIILEAAYIPTIERTVPTIVPSQPQF